MTVTRATGSTPRHAGAKMLVCADGSSFGTIGGGKVEQVGCSEAVGVAAGEPARRVFHNLERDLGMACGGAMELYIEPVAASAAALEQVVVALADRHAVELVTPLDGGAKQVRASEERSWSVRCDEAELVEVLVPNDRVLLFGCGHVGRAIGPVAKQVGFDVVLCDDQSEAGFDWTDLAVASFSVEELERRAGRLGIGDYAVIVTRDHKIDLEVLSGLLAYPLTYLGMIGSKRKIAGFRQQLIERGVATVESWARVHAPIGVAIGAETPEEIAVSVVAELIATRRGGSG